jgi:hypothetical protein
MRRTTAGVVAALLVCGVPWLGHATEAHAAKKVRPLRHLILHSPAIAVTSSTGKHLVLHVEADHHIPGKSDSEDTPSTSVTIKLETRNGGESHEWVFDVPNTALSVNAWRATLATSQDDLSGYGTLDLDVRTSGATHRDDCSGGYTLTRVGALRGDFSFDTKSSGADAWGAISHVAADPPLSRHAQLVKGHGLQCQAAHHSRGSACPSHARSTVKWQASAEVEPTTLSDDPYYVELGGLGPYGSGRHTSVHASQVTKLSDHAIRGDVVDVPKAAVFRRHIHHGSLTARLAGEPDAGVTGTASLTSTRPGGHHHFGPKNGCSVSGQHRVWDVDYHPGDQPLQVQGQIYGPIVMPSADDPDISLPPHGSVLLTHVN